MNSENQKVNFSFGWLALKLLGKSLYSNAWSAISELVANGFDAGAKNVYVYIDISDKSNAVVEIFDDGTGMNAAGIETYVKVGFNKRTDLVKPTDDDYLTMGRKGIVNHGKERDWEISSSLSFRKLLSYYQNRSRRIEMANDLSGKFI